MMDGPAMIGSGGAAVIATGVVEIGADMAGLRAGEEEARQIVDRLGKLAFTAVVGLDTEGLKKQAEDFSRTFSPPPLKWPVVLDTSGIQQQLQNLSGSVGGGMSGGGGSMQGATANLQNAIAQAGWSFTGQGAARTPYGVGPVTTGAYEVNAPAEGRGTSVGQLREAQTNAFLGNFSHTLGLLEETGSLAHVARRKYGINPAGPLEEAGRFGQLAEEEEELASLAGTGGQRGRGGRRTGGRSPFSVRGFGGMLGLGTSGFIAAYAADEALKVGIGFAEASQIEAHPERILRQFDHAGSSLSNDPFVIAQSKNIASIDAAIKARSTQESIPVAGSAMVLTDTLFAHRDAQLDDARATAFRKVEGREAVLRAREERELRGAEMGGNIVAVAREKAMQRELPLSIEADKGTPGAAAELAQTKYQDGVLIGRATAFRDATLSYMGGMAGVHGLQAQAFDLEAAHGSSTDVLAAKHAAATAAYRWETRNMAAKMEKEGATGATFSAFGKERWAGLGALVAGQGAEDAKNQEQLFGFLSGAAVAVGGGALAVQAAYALEHQDTHTAQMTGFQARRISLAARRAQVQFMPQDRQAAARDALAAEETGLGAEEGNANYQYKRHLAMQDFQLDSRVAVARAEIAFHPMLGQAKAALTNARLAVESADPNERGKTIAAEQAELKALQHKLGYRSGAVGMAAGSVDEALLATGFGMDLGQASRDRRLAQAELNGGIGGIGAGVPGAHPGGGVSKQQMDAAVKYLQQIANAIAKGGVIGMFK